MSSDDNDLWDKVIKTVTPAKRDDVLVRHISLPKSAAKKTVKQADAHSSGKGPQSQTLPQIVKKPAAAPADLRSFIPIRRAGIDDASARRLTKGSYEIEARLDLHGKTESEAHRALQQFILGQSRGGARTLLVITGKGARGQGVLRKKVPEWLQEAPLKSHILALSQASPKDGGGGALYVRLRRQRERP